MHVAWPGPGDRASGRSAMPLASKATDTAIQARKAARIEA